MIFPAALAVDMTARNVQDELKAKRTAIYNDWKEDLAEDAREDGDTYQIRFRDNRVWYWKRDGKNGEREFKVVILSPNGERELSCQL